MLSLMGKIRLQAGQPAEALAHVQESVAIFREIGSQGLSGEIEYALPAQWDF